MNKDLEGWDRGKGLGMLGIAVREKESKRKTQLSGQVNDFVRKIIFLTYFI